MEIRRNHIFFCRKKAEITVGEISFSDHFYKIYSINDQDQVLLEYDTENEDHTKVCGNQAWREQSISKSGSM
jgi:hypothetical protein